MLYPDLIACHGEPSPVPRGSAGCPFQTVPETQDLMTLTVTEGATLGTITPGSAEALEAG
jgi:hypothetical protein